MPEQSDSKNSLLPAVLVEGILPSERVVYRFNVSLITQLCSECVLWLVMKQAITASKQQIEQFTQYLRASNNRLIQMIRARYIEVTFCLPILMTTNHLNFFSLSGCWAKNNKSNNE